MEKIRVGNKDRELQFVSRFQICQKHEEIGEQHSQLQVTTVASIYMT